MLPSTKSFGSLSGVDEFTFDKTRSKKFIGKKKERKSGQSKVEKRTTLPSIILDRAFL